MTYQLCETLAVAGESFDIGVEPLDAYLCMNRAGGVTPISFYIGDCWRGYVGHWTIESGRLYLVALEGTDENHQRLTLGGLFPGYAMRVFAHWFSGEIPCHPKTLRRGASDQPVDQRGLQATAERVYAVRRGILTATAAPRFEKSLDSAPTRQPFTASQALLQDCLSIAEIEAREIVLDPMNGAPVMPFGHLYAAWRHFKSEYPDQSGFWPFQGAPSQLDASVLVSGYAAVVGDAIVDEFLTEGQ